MTLRPNASFYSEISKVEAQADGTIKVWGIGSSEAMDSDGEIITAEAIRRAIPRYLQFPAVREMHLPIAAGTMVEVSVDADNLTRVCAHVVDEGTVKKVQTGVLRGFSLRGPIRRRRPGSPNIIDELDINEWSLVDRPANALSVVELWKADLSSLNEGAPVADDKDKNKGGRPSAHKKTEAKKSVYDATRLACLLEELMWLQKDVAFEAAIEGDGSPVPARLKEQVVALAGTLETMIAEEVSEAIGDDDAMKAEEIDAAVKAAIAPLQSQITELKGKLDEAVKVDKGAPAQPAIDEAVKVATTKLTEEKTALEAKLTEQAGHIDELIKVSNELVSRMQAKGYIRVVEKSGEGDDEVKKRAADKDKSPVDLVRDVHRIGEALKGSR